MQDNKILSAEFYDELSDGYDDMTQFETRLQMAVRFIDTLSTETGRIRTALDVGCGTGAYAIALAMQGVETHAVDLSEKMIAKGKQNASEHGVAIRWLKCPMEELGNYIPLKTLDLLVCLGNVLPHVLEEAELRKVLFVFGQLLRPGGCVVLQTLNYERVLEKQERLISADRSGEHEYIRFYDFLPDKGWLRFNLLHLLWRRGCVSHYWSHVLLNPYRPTTLSSLLEHAGFGNIEMHGGLELSEFKENESETVLIIART